MLGVLPGQVGLIQVTEAIKLILGIGDPLVGRLLHFDALGARFREIRVRRNPACPVCGDEPTITGPIDYQAFCGESGPADKTMPEITPEEAAARLADDGHGCVLLDVRELDERKAAHIQDSLFIPIGEVADRLHELPRNRTILVHCKLGGRGAKAVETLRKAGFEDVLNVVGGIDVWCEEKLPGVVERES